MRKVAEIAVACHSRKQAKALMLSCCVVLCVLGGQQYYQDLSYDEHRKLKDCTRVLEFEWKRVSVCVSWVSSTVGFFNVVAFPSFFS